MTRAKSTRTVPDNWTPDKPHPDPRRERYCRMRSQGGAPSACYRAAISDTAKATSVKASAHHVDREEAVADRVRWLRKSYAARIEEKDEPLTGESIAALMYEVSDVLQEAHDVAEGSVASESDLSRIRQRLTVHIGRVSRSDVIAEEAPAPKIPGLDLSRLKPCRCHE